jgi:hypothetical protein
MLLAQLKETALDTRSESGFILLNPTLVAGSLFISKQA